MSAFIYVWAKREFACICVLICAILCAFIHESFCPPLCMYISVPIYRYIFVYVSILVYLCAFCFVCMCKGVLMCVYLFARLVLLSLYFCCSYVTCGISDVKNSIWFLNIYLSFEIFTYNLKSHLTSEKIFQSISNLT